MTSYCVYIIIGTEHSQINRVFYEIEEVLRYSARIALSIGFSKVILFNVDDMWLNNELVYGCMIKCNYNPNIKIFVENLIIDNLPDDKPVVAFDKIRSKQFVMSKPLSEENN